MSRTTAGETVSCISANSLPRGSAACGVDTGLEPPSRSSDFKSTKRNGSQNHSRI
ncbi:MAG: hypothetical protein IKR81_11060 [Victivallales bacterium]|nr:hypothetical protein [Victivallales bacterium]